ncbi:MAG: LysM peptidoglycan-binding domain-containing protein [Halobacteriovoraceae bacterium]|nr:LysM peptidoglycan-binding domain-containing protein [Halobacteriovoraceae bacterium]
MKRLNLLRILAALFLLVSYSCSKSQDSKDASEEDIEMVDGEEAMDGDEEMVDSEEGWDDEEGWDEEGDEEFADDEGSDEEGWDEEDEELAEDDQGLEDELEEGFDDGMGDESIAGDVGGDDVEALEAAEDSVASSENGFDSVDGAPLADTGSVPMAEPVEPMAQPVAINDAGGNGTYTVQANETLMLIAFKLYGDYTRWREIQRLNSDKLAGSTVISPGMQLNYNMAGSGFSYNPQGNPYLIQRGDTLGIISDKVYGTMGKWKSIWDNNRPLIKDPNLIFVGFTIYYLPDGSARDLASEAGMAAPAPAPAEEPMMEEAVAPDSLDEEFPEEI